MRPRYRVSSCAAIAAVVLSLQLAAGPARAEDRRAECSAKYRDAKAAGALEGLTWPQFFSRCMAELRSEPPAEAKPAAAAAKPEPSAKPEPAPAAETVGAAEPVPPSPATAPVESVNPLRPSAPSPAAEVPPAPEVKETAVAPKPVAPPAPATPPVEMMTAPVPPPSPAAEAKPAPSVPVFPTAIAPAYAKEKKSEARRKTCLDQFNANKATNSNGGLKWIEKGGGYLSLCNKRLKGEG